MSTQPTRFVQFVVKISKFCNLRCRYCYEYDELGDRRAMSREQLIAMYRNLRDYYVTRDAEDGQRTELRFIWHGGEPLVIPPHMYLETFADQREVFGDDLVIRNAVQTNLTILDDARIALLRDGFDFVGVSLDVFGGLRVNSGGKDSQAMVLANLDRARAAGITLGCITVLTRRNIHLVEKIYRFFVRAGLPFRVLPLFDGAHEGQHEGFEVGTEALAEACNELVDLWLTSSERVRVTPIHDYIQRVVRHLTPGLRPRYFSKRAWNPTVLVNTDGSCFSYGDPYGDPDWCLGNLFESSIADIYAGEVFERSCRAAEARMAANCTTCPYFGSCDGYSIAEEQTNCRELGESGVRACVFDRRVLAHVEQRLRTSGVFDGLGDAGEAARELTAL